MSGTRRPPVKRISQSQDPEKCRNGKRNLDLDEGERDQVQGANQVAAAKSRSGSKPKSSSSFNLARLASFQSLLRNGSIKASSLAPSQKLLFLDTLFFASFPSSLRT